ncbi:MAG: hypothetical protein A2X56_06470 [Nitrospirae bacterium GWC2_57_13]|nr:MAG: hypothetical protein A2X56_06470 [Nitrospirae bacterium GWC2_57_13]
MNKLANERSAYLRHAANQRIDWYPWSEEAFERAVREDKPVFLSTGAVWCHWCHVMAKESFEDDEVAALLNESFICIKLDRDERPDIDRRYQQAVSAMGAGGGWPLSAFLLPDKRPFFGGTYFPPEDRQGRPGFKKVLKSVSDFYQVKKNDAAEYAGRVMETLRPERLSRGELHESLLDEAARSVMSQYDEQHGGFGTAPKFPMPGALEFLMRRSFLTGNKDRESAVRTTLTAMARGGFHDQLDGGFHRYSVDEGWNIPHFEKMADDNAWLLKLYADAFSLYGDERFGEVARGIITFLRETLSDPEGGFFASQDADITPDDEGGFFTWTDEDLRKTLNETEYPILSFYLLNEKGTMHHDPTKRVLARVMEPEVLAGKLGMTPEAVQQVIERGREKLLRARQQRESPFVDDTIYTCLNGMLIAASFRAYRALGDGAIREFAVRSLERVLRERLLDGVLFHAEGIPAVLDDYVNLIDALVAAFEATAESRYLGSAAELMDACLEKFHDKSDGGFFDTDSEVIGTRLKRIEDVPHPSANSLVIILLLKLSFMTGRDDYFRTAEESLAVFAVPAQEMGIHAGAYFCALDAYFTMVKLTVEANPASPLAFSARLLAGPYTSILYGQDQGRVIPCVGTACYSPVETPEALVSSIRELLGTAAI